ncbi:Uncharacterized protein BM_BM1102 [Brugia malayi]|uniref:Bm1102 n=1 Tax=Brugia malayi TaxID=6279 RepID=A0A0K0IQC0_BRUMA|nr:Uncharacterized protein BM_BM1102 [Brugia malayi]CDQ03271.1 Bm1102 [Brugia malayi]VIP00347.1 Uncharacterized protein BM_BM1102 [Brugia malayi]
MDASEERLSTATEKNKNLSRRQIHHQKMAVNIPFSFFE